MRLIRCHIENFGVLSNFDFEFGKGLTSICENNGFGKSTFATFIKAMFYGFPRTGARNIIDNERKRYDPWQGGKYGGYLEFETQDVCYRVTRYFGKTAAKDTFSLLDLTNRMPSTKFSEKLGDELFQLDADSFARSTYVPQLLATEMEATTSIRTKLSNLVDDTNDLSNYDTAEKKLRDYRTRFRAYRGDGGTINDLRRKYLDLDNQKYQAEQQKQRLKEIIDDIEQLNSEKTSKTYEINDLREKMRFASEQKARQVNQKQFDELREDVAQKQQYLQEMDAKYPAGYPTINEIKEQREKLGIIQQEDNRLKELKLSSSDKEIVDTEKQWFSDTDKVALDIECCDEDCKELGKVSTKMTAQMLPEELNQLDILSKRFESEIPSEIELQSYMTLSEELNNMQRQLENLSTPTDSQNDLARLKKLFTCGIPDEGVLTACEQAQHDRDVLMQSRSAYIFPEEDQKQLDALKRTFATDVPKEEEIQKNQRDSRRIAELIAKKNLQTTTMQETPTREAKSVSKISVICGSIGVILLVLGIACFVMSQFVLGVILLASGFVVLLVAFWIHFNSLIGNQKPKVAPAISDEENQELYNLQHSVNDFLLRFYDNATEPDNKLVQLLIDTKSYAELSAKKIASENELKKIDANIDVKNQAIQSLFEQYYYDEPYHDDFVKVLRESSKQYHVLTAEADAIMSKRKELNTQIDDSRTQIVSILHTYYPDELPDDLHQGIRELSNEVKTYNDLKFKEQAMMEDNVESKERAEELMAKIREVLLSYNALEQTLPFDTCLLNLRKRFDHYKEASERVMRYTSEFEASSLRKSQANISVKQFLEMYQLLDDTPKNLIDCVDEDIRVRSNTKEALDEAQSRLKKFLKENPDFEAEVVNYEGDLADPKALQMSEKEIQEHIETIDTKLRELRQERDRICRSVENISSWEDNMARIKIEQEEDEKRCFLAEQALAFLSQAKDNLANSYVGKVERGFENYANKLMGEQLGNVMVDKSLHLYIDEKGAAREVGSFSTGTIDGIMLCMRLSLVDALFGDEKPFLILDDPFVNLDNEHTKRALEMLEKIAQDHQVVYLVCNTSRK